MGQQPKYPPGSRVVVSDIDVIERYGRAFPLVGWVDHNEEILDGRRHRGWRVVMRLDQTDMLVDFSEEEVSRVVLKRYGKLLRHLLAVDCPWCRKHGRDPRLPHRAPHLSDCQCWHHTHDEHLPSCPFSK